MAEQGLRREVDNPLSLHPKENLPARQLGLQGVQNPMQTAGRGESDRMAAFFNAMGGLQAGIAQIAADKQERDITQGKIDYMSGLSEEAAAASGNRYTMQGWQSLNAVDQANNLYMQEIADMENSRSMSPEDYRKRLMQRRSEALKNLPNDPVIRKMFAAAYEDMGPRAAAQHAQAHMEWNKGETRKNFRNLISSGSVSNADASRSIPGSSQLRLSEAVVDTPYETKSDHERHIGILTLLGEAGGEGDMGMAAVAHVLKNRVNDPRWGGSLESVALADKQFSTWNKGAGGNNPASRYKQGTPLYNRAARVYDAVMSGRHVDPTGGATHFYSPRGMRKLVNEGSQANLLPRWLQAEAAKSGGETSIGNHIFVGRYAGYSGASNKSQVNPADSDLYVNPMVSPMDVARAQEVPVETPASPQTQVQELIRGYEGMSPEERATEVTEEIVTQLAEGNDSLYSSVGGVAFLKELGASPAQIRAVMSAHRQFVNSDNNRFNVERERTYNTILDKASKGDTTALDDIAELHATDDLDDQTARSLYRQVSGELSKVGDNRWRDNPEAQESITNAYQFMKDGGDLSEGFEIVRKIGEDYDLPSDQILSMMDQMRSLQERRIESERQAVERKQKEYAENQVTHDKVQQALSQQWGLKSVQGVIKSTDENGVARNTDAQQYGVALLQKAEYENAREAIAAGTPQEQAIATADTNIYSNLRKQDVVDKERQGYITGALTGNLLSSTGEVSRDSLEAFEFYMRMAEHPDIGDKYMSQYLTDDGARALVHTARGLYAGRYNLEDALKKAYTSLNDPNVDVQRKMANDGMFSNAVGQSIDRVLTGHFGTGVLSTVLGDAGFAVSDMKFVQDEAKRSGSPLRREITRAAQAHYLANPRISPENAVKMAVEDVGNNMDIVAGNMVMGNARQGKKLSQVMGLDDQGPRATQDAIDTMLIETGQELFGDLFTTQARQSFGGMVARRAFHNLTLGVFSGEGTQYGFNRQQRWIPDYNVTYDSTNGMVGIQLYEAPNEVRGVGEREILTGPVKWIDAAAMGTEFRRRNSLGEFNTGGWFTNSVRGIMELARPTE